MCVRRELIYYSDQPSHNLYIVVKVVFECLHDYTCCVRICSNTTNACMHLRVFARTQLYVSMMSFLFSHSQSAYC